jgi:hypothetical protein
MVILDWIGCSTKVVPLKRPAIPARIAELRIANSPLRAALASPVKGIDIAFSVPTRSQSVYIDGSLIEDPALRSVESLCAVPSLHR